MSRFIELRFLPTVNGLRLPMTPWSLDLPHQLSSYVTIRAKQW
jgi:hypothetical protein